MIKPDIEGIAEDLMSSRSEAMEYVASAIDNQNELIKFRQQVNALKEGVTFCGNSLDEIVDAITQKDMHGEELEEVLQSCREYQREIENDQGR